MKIKNKTLLEKVKALFAEEVKLAQFIVDDVTYEAEALEAGNELYIVGEEATELAPAGEYEIEGMKVIVGEDGLISEVSEIETPAEEEVAATEETPVAPLNLADVLEVNKWALPTDGVAFNVGDTVLVTWEDGDDYPLSSGEYELENGDKIQVDADGVIVLKTPKGEETVPAEAPAEASEETPNTELAELSENYTNIQTQYTELTQTVAELSEVIDVLVDSLSKVRIEQREVEVELEEEPVQYNFNPKKTDKVMSTRDRVFQRLYGDQN